MINICIIATIVIYLVGMLLVGFVYSKSNEDSSDFYLGGRTMGPLVTAMSHCKGKKTIFYEKQLRECVKFAKI